MVEPQQVVETGVFVRATADALSEGMKRVNGDVEGLLTTWHGDAANAYRAGWDDFSRGASDVLAALARIGELLDDAGVSYAGADDANARTLRSLSL